ncbi:hypothetical protein CO230_02225 [Chryseobacterium sp. 6424]|uniref:glycosyltransferase family 2 protein n=1 Tax=Chryseobacterium sp. 6424 TaxID=2039166 RepID=UPI000EFC75A4|nr:glycosyltransferase [Chryseobacterium sp. 6424]AYO57048.1 hypothetical protein CO230_02225 [Chryseobacterium sp. 6424]
MGSKELSIIIVTYNSSEVLREALNSIIQYNDCGNNIEVVVVDNASKDVATTEVLVYNFPLPIKFIKLPENKGYGFGNNVGIQHSSSPIILIMNPDVTLYKPVFNIICKSFKENPALGILGMQQYENIAGQKNPSYIISSHSILKLVLHKFAVYFNYYTSVLFCFSGACFAVRKEAFLEAGGYNEEIFLYGEESDLQYRLKKKSKKNKIKFAKSLGYIHKMHDRNLSIELHLEGVKSFLIIAQNRGISHSKMINQISRYYKFLYLYNSLRKTEAATFYRRMIIEIEKLKNLHEL